MVGPPYGRWERLGPDPGATYPTSLTNAAGVSPRSSLSFFYRPGTWWDICGTLLVQVTPTATVRVIMPHGSPYGQSPYGLSPMHSK